ncbi:MAG TPA: hypothetical protein VF402_11545, partial [Asticcacaulis sp.]
AFCSLSHLVSLMAPYPLPMVTGKIGPSMKICNLFVARRDGAQTNSALICIHCVAIWAESADFSRIQRDGR